MADESKGKVTPSRREAEAARRAQMKKPVSRKERSRRSRERSREQRGKQYAALKAGHGDDLPYRDRGPERACVRDVVDRRWNFAEFLLPILIATLVVSFFNTPATAQFTVGVYAVCIALTVIDSMLIVRGVRKALADRFDAASRRGHGMYAVMRSTQMRFMRLPKPQIARHAPLPERYR